MVMISKKGAVAFLGILAIVVAAGVFIWMVNQQEEGIVQAGPANPSKFNKEPNYPIAEMFCNDNTNKMCAYGDHAYTARNFKWGDNQGDKVYLKQIADSDKQIFTSDLKKDGSLTFCYDIKAGDEYSCWLLFTCTATETKTICDSISIDGAIFETGYVYKGIVGYTYNEAGCSVGISSIGGGDHIDELRKDKFTAFANIPFGDKPNDIGLDGWEDVLTSNVLCAYKTDNLEGTVKLYRMYKDLSGGRDYILAVGDAQKGKRIHDGYSDGGTEGYIFLNDNSKGTYDTNLPSGHCGDGECFYAETIDTCPGDNCPAGGGGDGGGGGGDGGGGDGDGGGGDGTTKTNNYEATGAIPPGTCDSIQGWACDADSPGTQIDVHFYFARFEGQPAGPGLPDNIGISTRASSNTPVGPSGSCAETGGHGFQISGNIIPPEVKDNKIHSLNVYALGVYSDGQPTGSNPAIYADIFGRCPPDCGDRYCASIDKGVDASVAENKENCCQDCGCPSEQEACVDEKCVLETQTCASNTRCDGVCVESGSCSECTGKPIKCGNNCVGSCSETECPGQPNNVNGICTAECLAGECGAGLFCDCPGCLAGANGGDECGATMYCNHYYGGTYSSRGNCELNECNTDGVCRVGEGCDCIDCTLPECGTAGLECNPNTNICEYTGEECAEGKTLCVASNGARECINPPCTTDKMCVNDDTCSAGEGCTCSDCQPSGTGSNRQYYQDTCEAPLVCIGTGVSASCGNNPGGHVLAWRTADEGQIDSAVAGQTVRLVYEHPNLEIGKEVTFKIFNAETDVPIGTDIIDDSSETGKASVTWTIPDGLTGTFVFRVSTNQNTLNPSGLESNELTVTLRYVPPTPEEHLYCEDYTLLGQDACEEYSDEVIENERERYDAICDGENKCECVWDSDEEECGFSGKIRHYGDGEYLGQPLNCVLAAESAGPCVEGRKLYFVKVLAGSDPNCKEDQYSLPCGMALAEMPFFGILEFAVCALGIVVIYVFIIRKRKLN